MLLPNGVGYNQRRSSTTCPEHSLSSDKVTRKQSGYVMVQPLDDTLTQGGWDSIPMDEATKTSRSRWKRGQITFRRESQVRQPWEKPKRHRGSTGTTKEKTNQVWAIGSKAPTSEPSLSSEVLARVPVQWVAL